MTTPEDPRPRFTRAAHSVAALASSLSTADLTKPTPCTEFDVRGLLGHVVAVFERAAATGRGENSMLVSDRGFVAEGDRWEEAIGTGLANAIEAWPDARLGDTFEFPWVTQNGAACLVMWTHELVVHGWDLSIATGRPVQFDDETLEVALRQAHEQLPMADRSPMWAAMAAQFGVQPGEFAGPFANAVPVAEDAPILDRIAAWNGRDPKWLAGE